MYGLAPSFFGIVTTAGVLFADLAQLFLRLILKSSRVSEHTILCRIEVCVFPFHKPLKPYIQIVYRIPYFSFKSKLSCIDLLVILQTVVKSHFWNRKVIQLLCQIFYDDFSKELRILVKQTFHILFMFGSNRTFWVTAHLWCFVWYLSSLFVSFLPSISSTGINGEFLCKHDYIISLLKYFYHLIYKPFSFSIVIMMYTFEFNLVAFACLANFSTILSAGLRAEYVYWLVIDWRAMLGPEIWVKTPSIGPQTFFFLFIVNTVLSILMKRTVRHFVDLEKAKEWTTTSGTCNDH